MTPRALRQLSVWGWLILVPILNWPAARLPFERDEGEYALAATIAASGGIPYRDVFLQKPPGIILAYRALIAATDGSALAIHVALLVLYILTAALLGAIAWRLSGRALAAALSIILYALALSIPLFQASAANAEAFMVGAVVAAAYTLVRAAKSTRPIAWVVMCGLAIGVAGMMKQTAAPHALWLFGGLIFVAPTQRDRWRWPLIACLVAVAVAAAISAPYFRVGAGRELLDGVIWHNLEYRGGQLERAFKLRAHVPVIEAMLVGVVLGLVTLIGIAILARKRQWWHVVVLGGWVASAWVGVSVNAVYRGHYLLQLLPPLVLFAALALLKAPAQARIVVAPLIVVFWILAGGVQWGATETVLADQRYGTSMFHNAALVGNWVSKQQQRSLYILGSEPEIYYYADAVPTSRYVIQNPLFGGFASSDARQREVWVAVSRAKPAWIITVAPAAIPLFPESNRWLVTQVDALLNAAYRPRIVAVRGRVQLSAIESEPTGSERQITVWERVR